MAGKPEFPDVSPKASWLGRRMISASSKVVNKAIAAMAMAVCFRGCQASRIWFLFINSNVGETRINHPPVITIFIGGIPFPSGWFILVLATVL